MNLKNYNPGPTEVRPELLQAQARAMISHRGADMHELMFRLLPRLKRLLNTEQHVILASCSATGVMEGSVQNLVADGGLLVLDCGAFSATWVAIAQSLGRHVDAIEVAWGQGFEPDAVVAALAKRRYDAVAICHNETSTGVMNPVAELARSVREHSNALVIVDSVSSMAGVEIWFDRWQLDVCLAGVQKAFALPPGLAVAAISKRAMERAKQNPHRGYYHDFVRYLSYAEKGETPATPVLPLLYALDLQLERIEAETMAARAERHRAMARLCQDWARAHARLFANERFLSPTVTNIDLAGKADPAILRSRMRERGVVLGAGYGKLKPTCFRIGHMGDHTVHDVLKLLRDLDAALGA
ncbi:MAG: alanine--glyoxylate aminotransferase family protein [Planctomycetota bacterium]